MSLNRDIERKNKKKKDIRDIKESENGIDMIRDRKR